MRRFWISRMVSATVTLFWVSALLFFVLRFVPGGPFDTEKALPPEILANIERQYGLHDPIFVQWFSWIKGLSQGDLKTSFQFTDVPVTQILLDGIPYSLILGSGALCLAILIGFPMGCYSAMRPGNTKTGLGVAIVFRALSGAMVSTPSFLIASLSIYYFSIKLRWLPSALIEQPSGWILPIVSLSLRPMGLIARMMEANLTEVMAQDYIRTAIAKGISRSQAAIRHGLRPAIIPLLAVMGPIAAHLVTGSFLIEAMFQLPGIGKYFVSAVVNRDYPLVMGVCLTYGVILLFLQTLMEAASFKADPRMRSEHP